MSHVTPQTALQLKAAGFPFGHPKEGDFVTRATLDNSVLLVTGLYEGWCWLKEMPPGFGEGRTTRDALSRFYLLLPTAEDILQEMPGVSIQYDDHGKVFICSIAGVLGESPLSRHNSMSETLAIAYLKIHRPK